MMGGSTPNIDRIGKEGMIFMDHYAQASCTAGRAAFITGQYPLTRIANPAPLRQGAGCREPGSCRFQVTIGSCKR